MKKLLFLLIIIPLNVLGLTYPELNSKIVLIYDNTDNKILYEKDVNKQTYFASITKIATVMTAIENIKDLNEEITITSKMMNTVDPEASVAGLKVGDKVTYLDLLYASLVPSGADATNSLAIKIAGSLDNYVKMMNDFAKKINLTETHFTTVSGLDAENHYSTANDILKLLKYALSNETFKTIFTTKKYTLSNNLKIESTLYLYNRYINKDITPIIGSKTGFTKKAGYCITSTSNTKDHEIIIILLGAPNNRSKAYHIQDDLKLISFLNDNYDYQVLIKKDEILKNIPVSLSTTDNYEIKEDEDITKFLPDDYDKEKIKYVYEGKEELNFLNKENEEIGKISYYYDNELITTKPVYLKTNLKLDFFKLLKRYFYIPLIIVILLFFHKHKIKIKKRKVK